MNSPHQTDPLLVITCIRCNISVYTVMLQIAFLIKGKRGTCSINESSVKFDIYSINSFKLPMYVNCKHYLVHEGHI